MIILPSEAFRALLPCYMMVTIAFVHACFELQARAAARATP
jgi:hypothetical protein